MKPVWIIDDDRSIRWVFEKALARENIAFKVFASTQEALQALSASTPQVVVSDIRMPGGSGLELLQKLKEKYPNLPVIIMTAYSDLESAVAAFQGGAFEYLPKPFDVDQAVDLIRRAMEESLRQGDVVEVAEESPEILGQAQSMQEVFRAIGRLTQSHATVLINGESGTGKELVARALHRHSPRAPKPFIAINTAAIPKDLLESELLGTNAAPSPAHRRCGAVVSNRLKAAPCFWTRSAACRPTCRHACCGCCRTVSFTASADINRSRPTCASSRQRIRTWKAGSSRACFARTYSID